MKIIHIISGDLWAGAEVQVFQTVRALQISETVEIYCILFNNGILADKLKECKIPVYIINETIYNTLSIIRHCKSLFTEIKPDLLHVHRNKEHLIALISARLSHKNIPIVRTKHGKSEASKNLKLIKYIKAFLIMKFDSFLITRFCNSIIAVSAEMKTYLEKLKPKAKIFLINNAVDTKENIGIGPSDVIRQTYRSKNVFWIGTAARLAPPKNLSMLLHTAAILKRSIPDKFKISIFGDGPLYKSLLDLADKLNVSDVVTIHGFEQDIKPIIASLDVFVLCSIHEGLPMALLEAMSMKKPVVCTAVGGMKEVIKDYETGLLVDVNDYDRFANQLQYLYTNPDIRCRLGINAQKLIESDYSIFQMVRILNDVYESLIKGF